MQSLSFDLGFATKKIYITMQENLVIVESPAKAKTIEKFLGKEFAVRSSFGHIRDLPKRELSIDIASGFVPTYEIPSDKVKLVSDLSKAAAAAKTVWLASDEDREGEAIAWHLTEVLGLSVENTKRIVFHEITKNAILNAIENPRKVDMNLVNAQQARRVLDRIVGFELSPILWKKVRPALSAGRVQSVAVRLIVEREREIINFKDVSSYRVVAQFYPADDVNKTLFKAEYSERFDTKEEALAMLECCKAATFAVEGSEMKPSKRYPAPPFTTSTLQQEAGRKFSMSVSQTMSVAQKLYERGLITYMRTDSVNLSDLALNSCKKEIVDMFGENYSSRRNYTTNSKGAQEAHEALRPPYMNNHTIEGTAAEKRLYELIWKRTIASQMVAADVNRSTITINMSGSAEKFVASGEVVTFDGFLRLYSESHDDEPTEQNDSAILPALADGTQLLAHAITATERYAVPPMRFSEPLLVKRLEELGIGRPSTYAPTISTIITRGYVEKSNKPAQKRHYTQLTLKGSHITEKLASENYGAEKNRLAPTDIGMVVNDYLEQNFGIVMDYNFTAKVEKEFDRIADGEQGWNTMIGEFYGPFHELVDKAITTQVEKNSQVRILGVDPQTGYVVRARIGRFGPMVEIDGGDGEKPRFASLKKGQLIEAITLEEALSLFALPRTLGKYEDEDVVVGIGKFGAYIRYGKNFASLAKGDDPYTITYERAVEVIESQKQSATAAATPLKTFDEDAEMLIKNGRYGAYIAYKGKNYRIPRGKKIEALSYADCQNIVNSTKK